MSAKAVGASGVCILLALTAGGVRAGDKAAAPRTVEQPGRLEAAEQANLYSMVAGYVGSVSADIGDHVKKGDVLAVVEAPELKAELEQKTALLGVAKAQVAQSKQAIAAASAALDAFKARQEEAEAGVKRSQAQSDFRKAEWKRFKQLYESNAGPVIDERLVDEKQDQANAAATAVEEAQAALKAVQAESAGAAVQVASAQTDVQAAEARVAAAEADVQRAQVMLDYARLQAPFDGVVTRRSVNPGDFVGPPTGGREKPLFVVARVDSVRVVVAVPERDAVRLKAGAPAVVRLDALKGQEFKGKVSRMSGAIDPETRSPPRRDRPSQPQREADAGDGWDRRPHAGRGAPDKPKDEVRLPFDPAATAPVAIVVPGATGADRIETELKKELVAAAETTYKQDLARIKGLQGSSVEELYTWSHRWLDAELDLAANKDERVAAHQRHLDRMKDLEKMAKAMAVTGQGRQSDATAAAYYRTQAELWLTRAQGQ